MAAAGPAPSKFMTNKVEPWLFGKITISSIDGWRSRCKGPRGWASKYQPAEVIWMDTVSMMVYNNAS